MHKILSSHLFVNQRLTSLWLERVRDAGFNHIEIFCARQHLDYTNRTQVKELSHWFNASELKVWSLHAPMYNDEVWGRSGPQSIINIAETAKAKRISMVDEIKRALEVADLIPFRYLIQHIGVRDEEFTEQKLDAAYTSLQELVVFAAQRNVEILIENTPNQLSNAARLNYFLGITHLQLNYCFDVGHAHMGLGIPDEFEAMKDRIRSTHIHDNDGLDDSHLFPLEQKGTIKWEPVMKLLGSRRDQFPLVLELREQAGLEHPVRRAKEILDGLEQLI
jgi:sugar phosphate isomerase/epimerase